MNVYLVRHAQALGRSTWPEPDERRPLSRKGERQAKGLVDLLADRPIARIASSPSLRCCQTVAPLAEALRLDIEHTAALYEGAPLHKALAFLHDAARRSNDGSETVLCSHGDVIPELLGHLRTLGLSLANELRWSKGSTWALTWDGHRFTEGRYLPPPDTQR